MNTGPAARLRELLDGDTDRQGEREVIELVAQLDAAQLSDVLEHRAQELIGSVDNHLLGPNLRDELLEILVRQRVNDVSMHALATLATVLQTGRTGKSDERALRDILLSRRGDELSHLKNTINLTRGRHDLEGLVFADIDDDAIRDEIISHLRDASDQPAVREAKILSDIDDTAIARIHDDRYPKGTVVPGVLAFYEALDVGPLDKPRSRGDLTFVTARPSDAFGLVKGQSRRTLTQAGIADLSIMTGSWFNVMTRDGMASKKVKNIAHYAQLFPEYDLVFVGDSGQGDILVAKQIIEAHPDLVRACFIHDVVAMPEVERAELAREGIWVVDTYIGAAIQAHQLGLVSDDGLRQVITETRELLTRVEWESEEQEKTVRELVERDARRASEVLLEH